MATFPYTKLSVQEILNRSFDESTNKLAFTGTLAPSDATYIVQTASSSLSAEQALGSLATGILKNTTTTGVLSVVAEGSNGQVLQTNGSGTYVWATVSSASPFDCTVGATGADYTTIESALAAGKSRLLVIANVTTAADCAVPSGGLLIHIIKGVTVAMSTLKFTYAASADVWLEGEGTLSWGSVVGTYLFANNGYATTATVYCRGIALNSSAAGATAYFSGAREIINDVTITLGNLRYCGFYGGQSSTWRSLYSNVTLVGGGSSVYNAIRQGFYDASNIKLLGTWNTSQTALHNINNAAQVTINNLEVNVDALIILGPRDKVVNVQNLAGTLELQIGGVNTSLSNVYTTGPLSFAALGDNASVSNYYTSSTITVGSGSDRNTFNNITSVGAVSITGNYTRFEGRVGDDAGGGATTITLNSGATGCYINAHVDAAAVDNSANATNTLSTIVY